MERTLEQLTQEVKRGNDINELSLIENFVMLEEIHSVLESIENKFSLFFREFQENVIAQREAAIEASRLNGPLPGDGDGVGDETSDQQSGGGISFLGIAALLTAAKIFDVDEVIRLPATLTVMFKKVALFGKQIDTLKDIFMAGVRGVTAVTRAANGTFQRLTQFQRYINDVGKVVGAFIKPLKGAIEFLKPIGTFLKPLGAFLKPLGTLFSKIALPITVIFGVLDAIEGFTKTYADTKSVLSGIRGAIVAVLDGLVGTLVRFAGEIVAFIPDILGLDAVAETIKNLFNNITGGILEAFGGIVDVILGIFSLDGSRIMDGLGAIIGGLFDALTELLLFPINSVINFVRDIFGFSKEDAPPFRMQDLIGEAVDSIKQWFADLFDFEFPSFDFDMNSVLRGLLPAPDSFFAKFIPDSVYESVGLNPQTGEALETGQTQQETAPAPVPAPQRDERGFLIETQQAATSRDAGTASTRRGDKIDLWAATKNQTTDRGVSEAPESPKRGDKIDLWAATKNQTPRGTGEVTARGAMAIPGPSQQTQATSETTKVIGRTATNPGVVVERNGKPVALSEEDRAYVESINAVRTAMGGESYDLSQNEVKEQRRGAEIPSQAGQQVQAPRGTGEVTARGAMAIPGVGTGIQQAGADQQQSGGGFLESITQTVSNASQTVSDVVNSTVTSLSDFASTTSDTVSQNVSQAVDYVSDVSTNIGDMVSENVVDPVTSFFQQIGEKIAGVLDISGMLSRIKDYMTIMFAEVGIPRVEMDVPVIGKVGFGPFYPFAPSNETSGGGKTTMDVISAANELKTESNNDQYSKQFTSRFASIEGVENYDVQYANASERERANMDEARERYGDEGTGSGISLSLRSFLAQSQGESESTQTTQIFGRQDYDTGKRYIEVEKTLEKYEGDSAGELEEVVQTYDVGPLQFGKVRRMIAAGASAEQVEEYLKETQQSVGQKLKSFLAPAADAVSNVTESVSNLFGGSTNTVAGGDTSVSGGLSSMVSNLFGGGSSSNLSTSVSNAVSNLFGGEQNIVSSAGNAINNASAIDQSAVSNVAQSITPVANKALTAPVGESSEKVKAAGAATNILAPTTNNISPVNNNTSVTNVNRTTVASASARSNDPSFMRLQNAFA